MLPVVRRLPCRSVTCGRNTRFELTIHAPQAGAANLITNLIVTKVLLFIAFAIIFTSGCSGKSSVTGTVKYPDGEPLTQGAVFFRNAAGTQMYQGALKPDGSFALGEIKDGDGIPPGDYTAWIAGANDEIYELDAEGNPTGRRINMEIIAPKFTSPETSDLSYTVGKGNNKIDILVERP